MVGRAWRWNLRLERFCECSLSPIGYLPENWYLMFLALLGPYIFKRPGTSGFLCFFVPNLGLYPMHFATVFWVSVLRYCSKWKEIDYWLVHRKFILLLLFGSLCVDSLWIFKQACVWISYYETKWSLRRSPHEIRSEPKRQIKANEAKPESHNLEPPPPCSL